MTITIVSLLDQVLNINLPTYTDYKFFSNLFESNDKGEILTIQIANKEFKSRLSMFDELSKTNKECLTMKSVFDGIPEDSRFLVVPNKIDDTIVLYHLRQEVDKLNGITGIHSNLDKTKYEIALLYYTQNFSGNTKRRHYIGEPNKSNRVCRFCGKQIPIVSFKNTSHAISESLGNKSIICREECDICNERFSRTIEPDIANMLSFLLTIHSIHGKNGVRTTVGENFKISLNESTKGDSSVGTIKIQLNQDLPTDIEDFFKEQLQLNTSSLKYIPQNVYKCLCKYVVSVINKQYLPDFKGTIDWINSTTKYNKLPFVAIGNAQVKINAPYLILSVRKTNNYRYPYCFALFAIANIAFAFIVPYTSVDKLYILRIDLHPHSKKSFQFDEQAFDLGPPCREQASLVFVKRSAHDADPTSVHGRGYLFRQVIFGGFGGIHGTDETFHVRVDNDHRLPPSVA